VKPFKEWATPGSSSPWWRAFTHLKHDRLTNFREATFGNCVYALAADFVLLTLSNEHEFKDGHVSPEVYDLFFPKYWTWKGRVMPGVFTWS
jgi:hypothetical protein